MSRSTSILCVLASALAFLFFSADTFGQQRSTTYRGAQGGEIMLPMGDISFADRVVAFHEGSPASRQLDARDPEGAIGPLDFDFAADTGRYVTLGCRGSIVLAFSDNALIDQPMADLHVWEIGPDAEPTRLEISANAEDWIEVGRIAGGTASVDIADFVSPGDSFRFVRLTDIDCLGRDGDWPGADIAAVAAVGTALRLALEGSVLFDFDNAELKPGAGEALDSLIDKLDELDFSRLAIIGHTDARGADAYNLALSQRRAWAVADYLTPRIAPDVSLDISGRGESEPVESNQTDEGRAANRRVEIIVMP